MNKNRENDQFTIRPYGYKELACLYFPNSLPMSASGQLKKWLDVSEKLQTQLKEAGYRPYQKLLTPRQVELIVNHLGPPDISDD